MKTLELSLNKRLLIVESEEDLMSKKHWYDGEMHLKIECICKGSELTEEIAKGFSGYTNFLNKKCFADYISNRYSLSISALQSFISAIEAAGYHWGENPLGKKPELTDSRYNEEREFIKNNPDELVMGDHYADWSMWQESESRTFTPEKCIIFEIL